MKQHENRGATARVSREEIHTRISHLKRAVAVGAVALFGALWALVGTHTVGVTAQNAHQQGGQQGQTTQDPGNFFNNAGNGDIGPGSNGGMATSSGS